jgi:hypothetical protein
MIASWVLTVLSSAGASALLVVALGFLLRNLITERLSRAVAHEYDARMETLRLQNERVLEALREARAERESFRGLAIAGLTAFQAATIERRINAIDVLWQSLQAIKSAVPYYIHLLDMVGFSQRNVGPRLHDQLRVASLVDALAPWREPVDRALHVRPFLGERLFALFFAAQAILGRATSTTISSYHAGAIRPWHDEGDLQDLLSTVLDPDELAAFRARQGQKLDWLYRHFEGKIMAEIERVLSGGAIAADSLSYAHRILDAANLAEPEVGQHS